MSGEEPLLEGWVAELADALGLDVATDVPAVLDLAGDAAHGVVRPAAPLTTFLAGVAVGRGARLSDVVATVHRVIAERDG